MQAQVKPLPGPLGAEVSGIDLASGADDRTVQQIRDAVLRHALVVLHDQSMTASQHAEFMSRLYPLRGVRTRVVFNVPECPSVNIISNIRENGRPIGASDAGLIRHTDQAYTHAPELFISLHAIEVPYRDGKPLGDTEWTSTTAAYDALDSATKDRVASLKATQSYHFHLDQLSASGKLRRAPLTKAEKAEIPDVEHAVVRTHPITGRKILYVNESFTSRIHGMPAEESGALLHALWAHLAKPEFNYRHSWRDGDLVVWDNLSTQHLAFMDYGDIRRRLHRCATQGPGVG